MVSYEVIRFGVERPDTEPPTIEITEPVALRNARSFQLEAADKDKENSLRLAGIARDNVGVTVLEVNNQRVRTMATQHNGKPALRFEYLIDLSPPPAGGQGGGNLRANGRWAPHVFAR